MTATLTETLPLKPGVTAEDVLRALRFVAVGAVGTMLYAGLYVAASALLSTAMATVSAFICSTLVTNVVHRRVTYGVTGSEGAGSDSAFAFGTALVGLVLSAALTESVDSLGVAWEVPMLIAGSTAGGAFRFVLMSWWLARPAR